MYTNLNNSKRILNLAKFEMLSAVSIARERGNKEALALPLYNLAQLQEDLEEYTDAVNSYQEAVENMQINTSQMHNRPSVIANMRIHMSTCEYKAGDKTAVVKIKQSINELITADEPNKYNKDVWLSGGYMRLAEVLRKDDLAQAKLYLSKAKEIIDSNPELILRKKQWEQFNNSFINN